MAPKQEVEERDFTAYADKEPTGTMDAFADWLIDEVGLTFSNKNAEKQFREGVRLGGTLRMEFQASDYWKSDERNPRSEAGRKARATANGSAKETPKATRGKAKAQVEADEATEDEAPAKPARRTRGPAKATAAKPAAKRGRPAGRPVSGKRGAAAKPDESAEAPY